MVPPAAPPAPDAGEGDAHKADAAADSPEAQGSEAAPAETEPPGDAEAGGADLSLEEIQRAWPAVLEQLAQSAPALAATFEGARPVAMDEGALQVGFPEDRTFNKRKAESPERREAVAAAFEAVVGKPLRPTYIVLDGEPTEGDAPAEETPKGDIDHDALVEKLKSEFDAEEVS